MTTYYISCDEDILKNWFSSKITTDKPNVSRYIILQFKSTETTINDIISIILPKSLKSIDKEAFSKCSSLK